MHKRSKVYGFAPLTHSATNNKTYSLPVIKGKTVVE